MAAQPDKRTVIKDLLELGKSKGQLSTKEILDALGELDFDPEHVEKFYDTLESQGVEIVEDFGDDLHIDEAELAKVEGADELDPGMGADGVAIDDRGSSSDPSEIVADTPPPWARDEEGYFIDDEPEGGPQDWQSDGELSHSAGSEDAMEE